MIRRPPRSPLFPYTPLFRSLTASIWAEAGVQGSQRARNTTSIRRDLQRLYLTRLLRMVVTPEPGTPEDARTVARSEEHTSELQSPCNLVCRLLLEKKNKEHSQNSLRSSTGPRSPHHFALYSPMTTPTLLPRVRQHPSRQITISLILLPPAASGQTS